MSFQAPDPPSQATAFHAKPGTFFHLISRTLVRKLSSSLNEAVIFWRAWHHTD
jgi:hypothetical protein